MHNKNIWSIYPEDNGVVWFGTTKGLIRYDTKVEKDYQTEYHALIRKVMLGEDSIVFWGTWFDDQGKVSLTQPNELKPELSYAFNSLSFQYAAPFFDKEDATSFSYYLVGYDDDWSGWSLRSEKEYTNLPEGNYTFHVKAKNVYEYLSRECTYEFTILTPFYRSWWFYGMQIGFLLLLFVLSFYFSRSGGRGAKLARIFALVAIVVSFEYLQNYVEDNFENVLGGITVLKVLVNVLLIFLLLPVEALLKRFMGGISDIKSDLLRKKDKEIRKLKKENELLRGKMPLKHLPAPRLRQVDENTKSHENR